MKGVKYIQLMSTRMLLEYDSDYVNRTNLKIPEIHCEEIRETPEQVKGGFIKGYVKETLI